MNDMQLEQAVKSLLVEACGSEQALEDGVDLLESELLDSLGFISLLDGLEDIGISIQPTQVDRNEFRTLDGILNLCRKYLAVNKLPQRQKLKSLRQFLFIGEYV